jgi:NDP-sugar pyrophosphorylase family protein
MILRAIILAGGRGTRLRPYTSLIPKPLVPIGNETSILEILISQLERYGFEHVTLSVNKSSDLIIAYISNKSRWKIKIDFSIEEEPLSTIGPLTLIEDLPENFLVMNGDLLTDLNFKDFYDFHVKNNNMVTVSTIKRDTKIQLGVLQYDENHSIKNFIEKPVYNFYVSMGIHCINKSVIKNIPKGTKYGFDDLMVDGIKNNCNYKAKVFKGFWLDIGMPEDYDYCNENYAKIKKKLGV